MSHFNKVSGLEPNEKFNTLVGAFKEKKRKFAGLGWIRAIKRLKVASGFYPQAEAILIALAVEQKVLWINVASEDGFRSRMCYSRDKAIIRLMKLFFAESLFNKKWIYGLKKSDIPEAKYIAYFEIPYCKPIFWYFNPLCNGEFKLYEDEPPVAEYTKDQDGTTEMNWDKLATLTEKFLRHINKY